MLATMHVIMTTSCFGRNMQMLIVVLNAKPLAGNLKKKKPDGRHAHKVPMKVLRYFSIAKRLKRLFLTAKSATDCRWHDEGRTRDGLLRHPADSPAWKHFDSKHIKFFEDSRNIRLIITTDGFNPFRSMNCAYSVWPVMAIPINLPPWLCMKQQNFILSLLIPGPKSPGSDIDVFLEPLIDDLDLLFEKRVWTYDASKSQYFDLHAVVHSTITDLPGLATLAGIVTSGEYGCPKCHSLTCSLWMSKGMKTYMDHRRFLDPNHRFRTTYKAFFDGKVECRTAPEPLTGAEVDALTENMETVFGKDPKGKQTTRKRKRGDPPQIFKRRSIWFRLQYWKDLLQPHNIDAMHIEKNVCDNIVNTLLGIDGKPKDNINSRRDLELLGIRKDLQHVLVGKDTFVLPAAPYSMSPELKRLFCQVLKGAMFPHGYASDIRKNVHVKENKIVGLKSHDCHILLQQLFPLAVRKTLLEGVSAALIRVSRFFKKIYSPVISISDMEKLEEEIAETLRILETIFLPSFFDMMVHLMVHFPLQVRLGGPVKYISMYPSERYLCKLKGFVRTKSHPEGSIAEGYIFDECLNFCARYLEGYGTRISRKGINDAPEPGSSTMPFFNSNGHYLAGKYTITIDQKTWLQAHRYVLFNYDNIFPYWRKHLDYLSSTGHQNASQIDKIHPDKFHEWLRLYVAQLIDSGEEVFEEIQTLAKGPLFVARTYGSYNINGYNFHTKSYDEGRPTQSSGVALVSKVSSSSNESRTYYGVITQIIELDYDHKGNVVLFKCEWFDNRVEDKWVKVDRFGITNVNRKHLVHTGHKLSDEPFILASQATQVYYVEDPLAPDWLSVRQPPNQRDLYDMFGMGDGNCGQADGHTVHNLDPNATLSINLRDIPRTRTDIDGVLVSAKEMPKKKNGKGRRVKQKAASIM